MASVIQVVVSHNTRTYVIFEKVCIKVPLHFTFQKNRSFSDTCLESYVSKFRQRRTVESEEDRTNEKKKTCCAWALFCWRAGLNAWSARDGIKAGVEKADEPLT